MLGPGALVLYSKSCVALPMTKAVIHIGSEKTGTKSIQHYLSNNRAELFVQKVKVPDYLGYPTCPDSHIWLPIMGYSDENRIDDLIQVLELTGDKHNRAKKIEERVEMLRQDALTNSDHTFILTSEHLLSRLRCIEDIELFLVRLRQCFEDIKILVYLRDPLQVACGIWSTRILSGEVITRLPQPSDPVIEEICNYSRSLSLWSSIIGADKICVRRYLPISQLEGSNLIDDFCKSCSIPSPINAFSYALNSSIGIEGLRLLCEFNQVMGPNYFSESDKKREILNSFILKHLGHLPKYRPTHAETEEYRSYYSSSDAWVEKNFFDGEAVFNANDQRGCGDADADISSDATPIDSAAYRRLVCLAYDILKLSLDPKH